MGWVGGRGVGGLLGYVPCSRDFDVWRVRCGMSRLGRTFRMSCECWGFRLLSNLFLCLGVLFLCKFCL